MKILICCATSGELKVVKEEIKKLNLKTHLPITYLCTGIGNHETIFQLTKFLLEHPAEQFFIVNIGVCGYFSQNPPYPPTPLCPSAVRFRSGLGHFPRSTAGQP
ncbi:MAG: hypothetical protein LBU27_07550 [Candidatus Peribacteria bacterium]|jgi:hypothetical protein|nr:hypothetical protein [Candidatus Peribacteria bacterium]